MSQQANSRRSYFTWSLVLGLLLLAGVVVLKGPAILQATDDNMAAITILQDWGRKPKDLSQVNCRENDLAPILDDLDARADHINAARQAYYRGDCQRALAYWTLALEADPGNETAAIMRFLSSGVNEDLRPAGMSVEETAEFLQGLGAWAEKNQREDQALYWFTNAFETKPTRVVADRLVRSLPDDEEKTAIWQKLAGALPEDEADHWWALGQQAELAQRWDEAADAYAAGAQIAADSFDFLIEQGLLLLKLDRLDEAEAVFQEAVALRPDNSQPYTQLGHVARQRGDLESARDWYKKAVQIAPDKFNQNYRLGITYYDLGQYDLANQYLVTAVEINPKNAPALYYLAQTAYQSGRQSEAQSILEEAISYEKESHWNWLVTLGDWRAATGDDRGALEAYKQALSLQPDHPRITSKIQEITAP